MSLEKCEFLGHSTECFANELNDGDYCLCKDYPNCYYKQLQTAKEYYNTMEQCLRSQILTHIENRNDTIIKNILLTQQNKQLEEDIKKIIFGLYLMDDKPHQGWTRFRNVVEKYEPDNKEAIQNCDDMLGIGFDTTSDGLKEMYQQNKQLREALKYFMTHYEQHTQTKWQLADNFYPKAQQALKNIDK